MAFIQWFAVFLAEAAILGLEILLFVMLRLTGS